MINFVLLFTRKWFATILMFEILRFCVSLSGCIKVHAFKILLSGCIKVHAFKILLVQFAKEYLVKAANAAFWVSLSHFKIVYVLF